MEEEIDLRPYVELLLRNWVWIVGGAMLAAVVAFGLTSLIPPTYEATALVAVTEPRQRVQFDPRFETVDDNRPLQAYPELATSDELLQNALTEMAPPLDDVTDLQQFRQMVEARSGSDPSLVRLTARYSDADGAARIVNTWAELFVAWANEIYGDQNGEQVDFFESQLEQAAAELKTAEQALIDFQAHNRVGIVNNQLNSLSELQAQYLKDQNSVVFLIQDIQGLRDQLATQSDGDSVTFADQLTALFLQIKAFNAQAATPLQLQVSAAESFADKNRGEQIAFLEGLVGTLESRSVQTEERLAELEPQILGLQQQKREMETESERLIRNRDVAQETYTALARKVEEERITSQDTSSGVRLASQAAVPVEPVGPRRLLNTVVAGGLGLMLGVFSVFIKGWWRASGTVHDEDTPETKQAGNELPAPAGD